MTDIFVAPKQNKPITESILDKKTHFKKSSFYGGPHMSILSSFTQNPKDVSFQAQKDEESIILFLRSHFITNISWIMATLALIALPLIILTFLSSLKLDFLSAPAVDHFILVFTLFYYLLIFSYVFISFLHWFYNVFIVTSERIVDIDYSDIVVHNIAVTGLSHVQDVNYTQSGFLSTFFDYGNVFVQTAGHEMNFEALSAPKPREATHIIGDLTGIK